MPNPDSKLILHVASQLELDRAAISGMYTHGTFKSEGFIHCCFEKQLNNILETYYTGQSDFVVLELLNGHARSDLKIETGHDGEDYPHIYGLIAVSDLQPYKQ